MADNVAAVKKQRPSPAGSSSFKPLLPANAPPPTVFGGAPFSQFGGQTARDLFAPAERPKTEAELFSEADVTAIINGPIEVRASVNRMLQQAGLLDPDAPLGAWGTKNATALRQVFATANQVSENYPPGKPKEFYFNAAIETISGGQDLGAAAARAAKAARVPPVQVSNPADLKAVLQDSSTKILGRRLSTAEEDAFVKTYQQQEVATGQAARDQSGGTITQVANAGSAAEQFIQQRAPGEAQAQGVSLQLENLKSILSRSFGGAVA